MKTQQEIFEFLTLKYVQSQDERQLEMGLQYTIAETHDLAKEIHTFLYGLCEDEGCPQSAIAHVCLNSGPYAWRFTGIAGLVKYMTQRMYDAQPPEIKKWYEPYQCASCSPHSGLSHDRFVEELEKQGDDPLTFFEARDGDIMEMFETGSMTASYPDGAEFEISLNVTKKA